MLSTPNSLSFLSLNQSSSGSGKPSNPILHVAEEETEAERREIICPRLNNQFIKTLIQVSSYGFSPLADVNIFKVFGRLEAALFFPVARILRAF